MSDSNGQANVLADWSIPSIDGSEPAAFIARAGEVSVVVGANGAGKSALGAFLMANGPLNVIRIAAHRRLWFSHAGPAMASSQREDHERYSAPMARQLDARYLDHFDAQKTGLVLFDLLARVNAQARASDERFRGGASVESVKGELGQPLMDELNRVFRLAGLPVHLEVKDDDTFWVTRDASAPYPIFKLSDGEKSALFLVAEVIAAPRNSVLVIDEPERHLHRAISGELVSAAIEMRPDCSFVVLTHDLDLAGRLSHLGHTTLAVHSVQWLGDHPAGWDLTIVTEVDGLPGPVRQALLGHRRELLFVEGEATSLDRVFYESLFPSKNVLASGSCETVIRSVAGLRASDRWHWVDSAGIVDGDGRTSDERAALMGRGVAVLPVAEVENMYLLPEVLSAVAEKQASVSGDAAAELRSLAEDSLLAGLSEPGTIERLTRKVAREQLVRTANSLVPDVIDESVVTMTVESPLAPLLEQMMRALDEKEIVPLLRELPVRDTSVRDRVARSLGFTSVASFQKAARVCIAESPELRERLIARIGPLSLR